MCYLSIILVYYCNIYLSIHSSAIYLSVNHTSLLLYYLSIYPFIYLCVICQSYKSITVISINLSIHQLYIYLCIICQSYKSIIVLSIYPSIHSSAIYLCVNGFFKIQIIITMKVLFVGLIVFMYFVFLYQN